MTELERALMQLRHEVAWPPTPDLTGAVLERLPARHRAARRWPGRPVLAYAAVALLALIGGAMAVAPARSAILEVLGLKGARIERRAPTATPVPRPRSARLGAGLGLGTPVTAAEAARRVGFVAAPPRAGLGPPDAVFFHAGPPPGGRVAYVYAARPGLPRASETGAGLLVTEFVATVEPVIDKAAGPGTRIEPLTIDGEPGFWLAGRPHGFAFAYRFGHADFEPQRLAAPTLLAERHGLLVRIEGRVSRRRAVAIARSVTAQASRAG